MFASLVFFQKSLECFRYLQTSHSPMVMTKFDMIRVHTKAPLSKAPILFSHKHHSQKRANAKRLSNF